MNNEGLHAFRAQIDSCIKAAEADMKTSPTAYIREISIVRTKLQEAKMWAGKCLEMSGAPFPKELRDEAKEVSTMEEQTKPVESPEVAPSEAPENNPETTPAPAPEEAAA